MVEASCHCGAVKIRVPFAPAERKDCNCSICRRLGVLWAYYPVAQVEVRGPTVRYRWGEATVDFHHCATCGCTTHWSPADGATDRMGVNSRLMDPATVTGTPIRRVDGANDTWRDLD